MNRTSHTVTIPITDYEELMKRPQHPQAVRPEVFNLHEEAMAALHSAAQLPNEFQAYGFMFKRQGEKLRFAKITQP